MIIHDVEQGSEEWHTLRAGIPTASEFSKLVTSTGAVSKSMPEYAMALAAEKYAGKVLDGFMGNKYTDRGKDLEESARMAYSMDNDIDVEQVGFITNDLMQYGCSPDGLAGPGLVEFKCQIPKEHVKTLMYFDKHGRAPTTYIAQVQGQMFVTGRPWCDLVFYHPDLPMLQIRITPDQLVIDTLKKQLKAVEAERNLCLKVLNK